MSEALTTPTNKAELFAQIDAERAALVALIEAMPPEARLTPLVEQQSVKDLVAHITDWEAYILKRIRAGIMGEHLPPRVSDGNYDRVNAEIYTANLDRSWDDIWHDFERTSAEMRLELEGLSEADIFDAARAEKVIGLGGDAVVEYIVGNTSGHYREHADDLRARSDGAGAGK